MVFEEAARLSYQLRQLWPQASALTPKAPAPPKFSHPDTQTHRLSNQSMQFIEDKMHSVHLLFPTIERGELLPVLCLKEPFKCDTVFESVDYVFEFSGCVNLCRGKNRDYFGIGFKSFVDVGYEGIANITECLKTPKEGRSRMSTSPQNQRLL